MPRTTLNLELAVLKELKRLSKISGKPLGQLTSELVAQALASRTEVLDREPFQWVVRDLGTPQIPLDDKERIYDLLDSE